MYIGRTNNLRRRFKEHNEKQSRYTRSKTPWILIYYEAYLSEKDVVKREFNLKQFKNSYSELKKRIAESLNET